MSYGNNRVRLDRLWGYADAVEHEANIKPIRGTDTKPIGVRRNKHMNIRREGEDIVCRLYQTDVVTYKPNGEIVIQIAGWASQTTVGFIYDLVGGNVAIFDHKVWVGAHHKDTKGWFPIRSYGENVFIRDPDGGYLSFQNPVPCVTHKVNRQGANNVRRRYKDFKNYVMRTCKLRADANGHFQVNHAERKEVLKQEYPCGVYVSHHTVKHKETFAQFQVWIDRYGDEDKTEDYYKAFLMLTVYAPYWLTVDKMLKRLDDAILFMHRDEVFVETECFGQAKRDPYSKFFG